MNVKHAKYNLGIYSSLHKDVHVLRKNVLRWRFISFVKLFASFNFVEYHHIFMVKVSGL